MQGELWNLCSPPPIDATNQFGQDNPSSFNEEAKDVLFKC